MYSDQIQRLQEVLMSKTKSFIIIVFIKITLCIFLNSIASFATLLIELNSGLSLIGIITKNTKVIICSLFFVVIEEVLLVFFIVIDIKNKDNFVVDEKKIFIWNFAGFFIFYNIFYFWRLLQIFYVFQKIEKYLNVANIANN